jgi:ribosomal protein S2
MHILDLNQTYLQFRLALKFLFFVAKSGGSVCFVATNPDIARILSVSIGHRFNNVGFLTRWFPGTLTNWSSVFDFISRAKENPELVSFQKNPKN